MEMKEERKKEEMKGSFYFQQGPLYSNISFIRQHLRAVAAGKIARLLDHVAHNNLSGTYVKGFSGEDDG